MRHLPRLLIASILIITTTAVVAKAEPVACDNLENFGEYTGMNPDTTLKDYQRRWNVKIVRDFRKSFDRPDGFHAVVDIPCDTKIIPAVYRIVCDRYELPRLELMVKGAGQCTLGEKPVLSLSRDNLTIFTRIRTPGFNGQYELERWKPIPQ